MRQTRPRRSKRCATHRAEPAHGAHDVRHQGQVHGLSLCHGPHLAQVLGEQLGLDARHLLEDLEHRAGRGGTAQATAQLGQVALQQLRREQGQEGASSCVGGPRFLVPPAILDGGTDAGRVY